MPSVKNSRNIRKRSSSSEGGLLILGGIILILFVIGLVGVYAYLYVNSPKPLDLVGEEKCPREGPHSFTIVLIDSSDEIPDASLKQVKTYLDDTADTLPEYGLLELRLLDAKTSGGEIIFSKCNPGDGRNLSELDANPKRVHKKWRDSFKEPLETALKFSLRPSESDTSPIMETIQSIALEHFTKARSKDLDKTLIIVSDMIEHGPDYSQYNNNLTYDTYKASQASIKYRTDLQGAKAEIYFVNRLNAGVNSVKHIEFWYQWFQENGGRITKAQKLQGAQ